MFLKCALPIKLDWNMIFPVLPGKQKMKDDLSQKNTLKFDIFCKCSEKIVFPKKNALEYDFSCTIKKYGISFSQKYDLTPYSFERK